MTAATLTPAVPHSHRLSLALRAVRAYGGAAVSVVLLGDYGPPGAGIRNPRPVYAARED
ncbi:MULTISPECIES: hypothetical protein [Streptomyces]|uniref:Uncharacterized protein n=1 Tax=Streptomyces solicathayae TaxID=3081768 RepID=A0ABZ0LWF0_9ACTN|nr:hypothetical protein [Streptomyces sp. HUAS YS2]WOX23655.1 hypothetical protein R2D22_20615 [Streptomyces sp. HUAS YS2]